MLARLVRRLPRREVSYGGLGQRAYSSKGATPSYVARPHIDSP